MSIHLSAITSVGGLPLFSRTFDSTGKHEKISFVNISTLNAINLFCNVNQGKLYSASTENCKVYWKSIDSITLIMILNHSNNKGRTSKYSFTDESFEHLLTLIYNLILMFCTKEELIREHLEKVKLKIKTCYFAIDYIIECFLNKTNFTIQSGCLEYKLGCQKCAQLSDDLINRISTEGKRLKRVWDLINFFWPIYNSLSLCTVDSSFACLNVDLKIVNATANYSEKLLSTIDGQLISLLLQAKLAKDNRDEELFEIEILLPQNCSQATSRLIYFKLSKRCSVIGKYRNEVYTV